MAPQVEVAAIVGFILNIPYLRLSQSILHAHKVPREVTRSEDEVEVADVDQSAQPFLHPPHLWFAWTMSEGEGGRQTCRAEELIESGKVAEEEEN